MAKPSKVALDPTAQFLLDQLSMLERFGGALNYLLLKPLPDGKVAIHSQDPRGFTVLRGTSLKPLDIPNPARLDNLGYLRSILELVEKNAARGKPVPLEFTTGMASDQKSTIIRSIGFTSADGTSFQFRASDPFLSKTKVDQARQIDWPVKLDLTPAMIEQFDDAARTHMAGALKADDQEFFRLFVDKGQISARFKSRAGEIDLLMGKTTAAMHGEYAYPIPQFRSVCSTMGPDGGIMHIAESAISIDTETGSGIYTFVMTKKILM